VGLANILATLAGVVEHVDTARVAVKRRRADSAPSTLGPIFGRALVLHASRQASCPPEKAKIGAGAHKRLGHGVPPDWELIRVGRASARRLRNGRLTGTPAPFASARGRKRYAITWRSPRFARLGQIMASLARVPARALRHPAQSVLSPCP